MSIELFIGIFGIIAGAVIAVTLFIISEIRNKKFQKDLFDNVNTLIKREDAEDRGQPERQPFLDGLPQIKDKNKQKMLSTALSEMNNYKYESAINVFKNYLDKFQIKDSERCAVLNLVAMSHYKNHNRAESIKALNEMISIAERIGDKEAFYAGKINLAVNHVDNNECQKAFDIFEDALEFYSGKDNFKAKADVLSRIGLVYTKIREDKKASKFLMEAQDIYVEQKDTFGAGKANMYLGINAKNVKAYDLAIKFYTNSLIFFKSIDNLKEEANALMNLGNVYYETERYNDALSSHRNAQEIFEQLNDLTGKALVLFNIGNVHLRQGKPKVALDYYQQALVFNEKISNELEIANCHNGMGVAYSDLREYEKAFDHLKIAKEKYNAIGIKEYSEGVDLNINRIIKLLK